MAWSGSDTSTIHSVGVSGGMPSASSVSRTWSETVAAMYSVPLPAATMASAQRRSSGSATISAADRTFRREGGTGAAAWCRSIGGGITGSGSAAVLR